MRNKTIKSFSFWKSNPIFRPAIVFSIGLLLPQFLAPRVSFEAALCLSIALLVLVFGIEFTNLFLLRYRRRIISISLFTLCVSAGALCFLSSNTPEKKVFLPSSYYHEPSWYKFSLYSKPVYDSISGSFTAIAHISAGKNHTGVWQILDHRTRLKWDAPFSEHAIFKSGLAYGQLTLPRNKSLEPFDYRQWLIDQGVGGEIKLAQPPYFFNSSSNSTSSFFENSRDFLLSRFKQKASSNDQFQFIAALLLGKKDELPKTLKSQFSTSGIIHLLAVSGLHVGLVFQLFLGLTWFIPKRHHWQRIAKASILIVLIWTYALLTGLSPSVCRASAMLSILAITSGLNRRNPSLNVLGGAWLLILIISPESIRSIGFLLSFAAVYGIIAAKPLLRKTRAIANKPLNYLVQAIVISIMAQLATLPLTLFTFGNFPVYFLVSNLIAIPLASCILYLGFACLFLQFLPYIGGILIQLCYCGVDLLIKFSALISGLPGATIVYRPDNCFSVLFVILITIIVLHIFKIKRSHFLIIGLFCITSLLIAQTIDQHWKSRDMNSNVILSKSKNELLIHVEKDDLLVNSIRLTRNDFRPIHANHLHYFVFQGFHTMYIDAHILPDDFCNTNLSNRILIMDRPSKETLQAIIASKKINFIFPVSTSDYKEFLNHGGEQARIWPIWFSNRYSLELNR